MTRKLILRDVTEDDLPIFFDQQLDPAVNYMAAFTAKEPTNHDAFAAYWRKIMEDKRILIKTILNDGQVVGHILSFEQFGEREVSYWIGKEHWGKGFANARGEEIEEYILTLIANEQNFAIPGS